jgi:hypothetical protein
MHPFPKTLPRPTRQPGPLYATLALLLALAGFALPAQAGPGHDHGPATPATTAPAAPRLVAESETFELVGVLQGARLTLYLDRFADNQPVPGAVLELEVGGQPLKAVALADGRYEATLPSAPAPGVLPVTISVTAGAEMDLLAGELDVHGDTAEAHGHAAAPSLALATAGWAAAAVLGLAWAGTTWRRARVQRQSTTPAAEVLA